MDTLGDVLPREIARVNSKKERWQAIAKEHNMGQGMQFSINMMGAEIERAIKALAEDDIVGMLQSLAALKGYDDND